MTQEKGITVMNVELSLCSKCNCMTKSKILKPFVYICGKCGHDKTLGDFMQYEAKVKHE